MNYYSEENPYENGTAKTERRETRRHQSLDKSMEHGFNVADSSVDIQAEILRRNNEYEILFCCQRNIDGQRLPSTMYARTYKN